MGFNNFIIPHGEGKNKFIGDSPRHCKCLPLARRIRNIGGDKNTLGPQGKAARDAHKYQLNNTKYY